MAFNAMRVLLGSLGTDASQLVWLLHGAAMMADRTLGPQNHLDMIEGGGFIVEVGAGQDGHCDNSLDSLSRNRLGLSNI
jgi:hypothetical protein